MCMLIEYLEYCVWYKSSNPWFDEDPEPSDYKGFLDAYSEEPRPEGFWRD